MVPNLKTFSNEGCKIAAQKKFVLGRILHLWAECFLVYVFLTLFNGLFAPTSWNPLFKLFRFLEFLGKSNGKKWSQIWKLLLIKGAKSPRQKKFFTDFFLHLFTPFKCLFPPTSQSPMSKLLRFSESLRKVIERNEVVWDLKTVAYKGCIGATIRIGREMLCLPYAGFFPPILACIWKSIKA